MKNIALILASGVGKRSGFSIPKQFVKINGRTVFELSIEAFEKNNNINEIITVVHADYINTAKNIITECGFKKVIKIISGGKERIDSSYNGIFSIDEDEANVLIHDSVRPFVTQRIIEDCIKSLSEYDAINTAIDVTDTTFVCENGIMKELLPRKLLKRSQTPQCFKLSLIKEAHAMAKKNKNIEFTDDCGLVLEFNLAPVHLINGDTRNIKLTYNEDFEYAQKMDIVV